MANDVQLVGHVQDGLFPINPSLLGGFQVVSVLPSTFGGLQFRVVRLVARLFARHFARNVKFATNGINRRAERRRRLFLVRDGAVDVLRMFLRREGIVLGQFASVFAVGGVEGVVREAQAVGDVRNGRILGDEELRLARVFLRAHEFGLRHASNSSIAVWFVDDEVLCEGHVGVRFGVLAWASVLGDFFGSERDLRTRRIRLGRSNVFGRQAFVLNCRRLLTHFLVVHNTCQCPVNSVVAASSHAADVCSHATRIALRRWNVLRNVARRQVEQHLNYLRFKCVVSNVTRIWFLFESFVKGRLYRAIQFKREGFLCTHCVFGDRLYNRHAMYGSVYRLLVPVLFHCPAGCFSAAIVVRIGVGVQR